MKFIIRNQAKIANKYIRYAKWKIRKLDRKFRNIEYSEIYIKEEGHSPKQYQATIRLGVPGPDIILTSQSSNLNSLWASLSQKMKRQLRKFNDKKK